MYEPKDAEVLELKLKEALGSLSSYRKQPRDKS
jgi:hypothetical protein